jgi:carboxypeptidase PM20D1
MRLEPVTEKAFSAREGIGKGRPVVADLKRRLVSDPERLRNELAPRDLALMTDTIAITRIGSDSLAQNAMARSAFADLDVRFLPSTDPDELIRWVRSTIDDENVKVEVVLRAPPGPDSPQTDVYLTIQSVLKQRFPAAAVVSDVSPALSENRLLRVRGIRTYGLTPFRLNIYDQSGIHGTNERIRTDWFEEGVETMKRIVAAWAGR